MRFVIRALLPPLFAFVFAAGCATFPTTPSTVAEPSPLQQVEDPYMGDWEGQWRSPALPPGAGRQMLCAQVIPIGDGAYRVNLLAAFDRNDPALAVLEGRLRGGAIRFEGPGAGGPFEGSAITATLNGKRFEGRFEGQNSGEFEMKHVVRLSPTLGKRPPRDAIVLFDGKDLDAWERREPNPWGISLRRAVGGDSRVAYVRSWVWSPVEQELRLGVGSDDGVKAWFNGETVLENNVERRIIPGEDKARVRLETGWNAFLFKVTQKEKEWDLAAMLRHIDGRHVEGLLLAPDAQAPQRGDTDGCLPIERFDGFLAVGEVSGPYMQDGKSFEELFDIPFAPEQDAAAEWSALPIPERNPDRAAPWILVGDGSMEVRGGSIVSTRQFTDKRVHVEFRTPYMPADTGQKRGNSGVFLQDRYEVQVLDSYGLDPLDNDCGGIYKVAVPRVNMCAPPLQWQTYDITFRAPRFDEYGAKTEEARITVHHNGVLIHENVHIPHKTTGSVVTDPMEPAGLSLQDHGNPVRFRNIWVVELEDAQP